jgi:hypothetical protein
VAEGYGDCDGPRTGVKPGALTALLEEVAATPEERDVGPSPLGDARALRATLR